MVSGVKPPPVPGRRVAPPPLPGNLVTPPPVTVKHESSYDLHVKRCVSLASAIKAKAVTVEDLYCRPLLLVGPAIVGERLVTVKIAGKDKFQPGPNIGGVIVPSNLPEAAAILSRAAKGNFLYFFNADGERVAESCGDEGKTAEYFHYNLPFFYGLSLRMYGKDWTDLVGRIAKLNPPLGGVLKYISDVTLAAEKALTSQDGEDQQNTPPPQVQSFMPPVSPRPPISPRPPVPSGSADPQIPPSDGKTVKIRRQ